MPAADGREPVGSGASPNRIATPAGAKAPAGVKRGNLYTQQHQIGRL